LNKKPEEQVEAVFFELPQPGSYFNFEKVCKRTHLDIASVNTAIYLEINNNRITKAHLSAGGVGPVPMYLESAAAYLTNNELCAQTISEAIKLAKQSVKPISDARGSASYKLLLLEQLIKAHFYTLELWTDIAQIETH
jgi:xanthine dehydrogenase small subunit